jgi:nucleotide-binding universal stress UspA family protein
LPDSGRAAGIGRMARRTLEPVALLGKSAEGAGRVSTAGEGDTDSTGDTPSPGLQPSQFEIGTDGPTSILVGIDGSDTSLRAGAYAVGLARRQGARLIAVYVRQTPAIAYAAEVAAAAAMTANEVADELQELVQQATVMWNITAEFISRDGDPFSVISHLADEVSADAIVVGASARLGHKIAGSLAVRLVKCGRWPVTVVP